MCMSSTRSESGSAENASLLRPVSVPRLGRTDFGLHFRFETMRPEGRLAFVVPARATARSGVSVVCRRAAGTAVAVGVVWIGRAVTIWMFAGSRSRSTFRNKLTPESRMSSPQHHPSSWSHERPPQQDVYRRKISKCGGKSMIRAEDLPALACQSL